MSTWYSALFSTGAELMEETEPQAACAGPDSPGEGHRTKVKGSHGRTLSKEGFR